MLIMLASNSLCGPMQMSFNYSWFYLLFLRQVLTLLLWLALSFGYLFLPVLPKGWDFRYTSPHPADGWHFNVRKPKTLLLVYGYMTFEVWLYTHRLLASCYFFSCLILYCAGPTLKGMDLKHDHGWLPLNKLFLWKSHLSGISTTVQ